MRIIALTVVGRGEADRWLEPFLIQLKNLCDEVIVCLNNADVKTKKVSEKYAIVKEDNREWGKFQPKIKQELAEGAAVYKPDWILAMDADEFLDKRLTRMRLEKLASMPHDVAYYLWCVQLWDREDQHREDYMFEDIRFYKYIPGMIRFKNQPVHGGIAPEYAYEYGTHSEFIFRHYGLMKKEDRMAKVARYEKYDPKGEWLNKEWYEGLKAENPPVKPFVEDKFVQGIPLTLHRKKDMPKTAEDKPKKLYKFLNPHGEVVVLDNEKHYMETKTRRGFQFLGEFDVEPAENTTKDIPFPEAPVVETPVVKDPELEQLENEPLKCPECGFKAKSELGIKMHTRKHGTVKP